MAWINYKNAYDLVPHSWTIEYLDLFGVAENIKSSLVNSMEKWRVMLCSGNSALRQVEIRYFSRRFFIPFSVCFSIESIKFDFKKG